MSGDTTLTDAVLATLPAAEVPSGAAVQRALTGFGLGFAGHSVAGQVLADIAGAGPLEPFLADPLVTDVLVSHGRVWVDRGRGVEDLGPCRFDARAVAVRLATVAGRRLDDASPVVDARLPSGVRLHAMLPPLSGDGVLISLRVPARAALTLADLVACGSLDDDGAALIGELVVARANVLVSGATGAGKTTVLGAMLSLVDPFERIVCVEEATELMPSHPHVVHLQARRANVEGVGEVTLSDLVRASLRMRPDRIVLGECRGAEVRDVLLALTTGHSGGAATIHANSAAEVPARLGALAALAGLPAEAVREQAASAFDVVVHVRRDGDLRHIAEVREFGSGKAVWRWQP